MSALAIAIHGVVLAYSMAVLLETHFVQPQTQLMAADSGLAAHLVDSTALLPPGHAWHDIISKAVRDELAQTK